MMKSTKDFRNTLTKLNENFFLSKLSLNLVRISIQIYIFMILLKMKRKLQWSNAHPTEKIKRRKEKKKMLEILSTVD